MRANRRVTNGRELALVVLNRVEQEGAYSNLELNQAISRTELTPAEISLATEIIYGALQNRGHLDYIINNNLRGEKKPENWVVNLLRLSLYQLIYLERVPEHAIVNEAVKLAKKHGHQGIAGLVNGFLRNSIRNKSGLTDYSNLSGQERLTVELSHPEWLTEKMVSEYGAKQAQMICLANNLRPQNTIRTNLLKVSRRELMNLLREELGVEAMISESAINSAGINIQGCGNLAQTELYLNGYYSIQDDSSMVVAEALAPEPGMRILDAAAAPGGKSMYIAEIMNNEGSIIAADLHPHRVKLIEEQVKRLGVAIVKTVVGDSNELGTKFKAEFDRILLDAPCSGLGVLRRKPELKWRLDKDDLPGLAKIQLRLLNNLAPLLKSGGALVYSTCTLTREENQAVIRSFLADNADYKLDPDLANFVSERVIEKAQIEPGMLQILPHHFDSDGFFIARMVKF